MRVFVVGSGGREHALAWRLGREGVSVHVAPGNGGTPGASPIEASDVNALANFAERERMDLTIVGPEAPLAAGIVDRFIERGLAVLGPTRAAARLEWSKAFAKEFLNRHAIPTGRAETVTSEASLRNAVSRTGLPLALKADGLAAGKGVFVVHTPDALETAIDHLYRRKTFGASAETVLVEEYLEGPELSVMALSDGERMAVMPAARDYKRLLDDDRGPNTGGMGGMARPHYATQAVLDEIERRVLRPTLDGMLAEGVPYRGVLYAGMMLTRDGPKVIEFNARFGDPEAELVLPLLESSLFEACAAAAAGALEPETVQWRAGQTYGVVLAASGYPESPRTGQPIDGLDAVPDDVRVFHAGTRRDEDGCVRTSGGRVLCIVGEKRASVYEAVASIAFEGKQFRRDIGAVPVGAAR